MLALLDPTARAQPGQAALTNGQTAQISDPRMLTDVAAANAQPTQAQSIDQIMKLANSGPMGKQLASAQLTQLFGSKNGRFTTTVHADPVNGGFVQVVTDSATGQSQATPLNLGQGSGGAYSLETAADGTRMKVFKNGAPSVPLLDSKGEAVKDPSAIKQTHEQEIKINDTVSKNKQAIGAIDATTQRLDTIDELADKWGGPAYSMIPDKVAPAGLRLYRSLIGQDVFSGVRDAVANGGEGAPRFTQGEFSHFEHNGGLNPDMHPQTVKELTAQQRIRLNAMKGALVEFGSTLPVAPTPPAAGGLQRRTPGSAPQQLSYNSFGGRG
jgi:hypothetical protein